MEMTSAKAMLVEAGDLEAADAVSATIPRDQIEAALASEEPVDLVLDVLRPGATDSSEATVSVAWERADLERLLIGTGSDAVTFSFKADELERAIDEPEFEGHGIRETVAVLTVAAAAAAAASSAAAKPMEAGGSAAGGGAAVTSTAAVHDQAIADARTGAIAAPAAESETVVPYLSQGHGVDPADFGGTPPATEPTQAIPYLSQGAGVDESQFAGTPQAGEPTQAIPYLSQGQGVDESQFSGVDTGPAAVHNEAIAAARTGPMATPTAAHDEASLAARGIETTPVHDEATLTARGIDAAPVAAHDEQTLVDRGIEPVPVSAPDSGFELPSVDPGTAAAVGGIAGGAALLIAAAAFAARGRKPIRPA